MKVFVKSRDIVIPGTLLADGMDYVAGFGTFREGKKIYASRIGLVDVKKNVIKIVPLAGRYIPKEGDVIIAKVKDITSKGWVLDINSAYGALMNVRDVTNDYIGRDTDLTKYLKIGDYVVAKIIRVTPNMLIDLTMKDKECRKLTEGRIVKFNPFKVPRVIGKQGSMINTIKKYLKISLFIGQNGLIWVKGNPEDELIFLDVLDMIDKQSHTQGLTERVDEYLQKRKSEIEKNIKKQ